jgi:hypothetical protein
MRKWLTGFILMAAMLGGAVGVGANEGEGNCPMTNMPDCCKKAHSAGNSREISIARLCCNLNCSEPGSSGTNTSSSFSPQPSVAPNAALMPVVSPLNGSTLSGCYAQSHHLNDSSPKYIQHLALLI